jgi:hypothetical protein
MSANGHRHLSGVLGFLLPAFFALFSASNAVAASRTHLYREASLALQYSLDRHEIFASPMPPSNSVGLEFIHSRQQLPRGQSGLRGLDFHLRLSDPPGPSKADVYFEDAWALFGVGRQRSQIRIGHFNIPFGMNPVMEPRGIFRMPLEAVDLGFKKDWGISWQRESGEHDLELGGFLASGGDLHWRRGSFLLAGRLGTPTYREFEYGFSMLIADAPPTMGDMRMGSMMIRRVRAGLDAIYLYGTHTILKSELTAGSDDGRTVGGLMAAIDWIPPRSTRWVLALQSEGLKRNSPGDAMDMLRVTAEASYSLGDLTMLRLDLVRVLESSMGTSTEIFFMVHHYGR